MKWYNDGNNDIWFFGGCQDPSKFVSQRKERHILRIIIDFCYRSGWDPFIVLNYYCASDMAQLISDGCAHGYFYDESKLLNGAADLGLLKLRDNDWDIIIFH